MDDCLISALVERWRPTTNSFYFAISEATVTLEDVGFILGLPVTGLPLTIPSFWDESKYVQRVFKDHFDLEGYDHGGVKFSWLKKTFGFELSEGLLEEEFWLYSKTYLVLVTGAVLFPSTSKNVIHPRYLVCLEDLTTVYEFTWGAVILSHLYRGLMLSSQIGIKNIAICCKVGSMSDCLSADWRSFPRGRSLIIWGRGSSGGALMPVWIEGSIEISMFLVMLPRIPRSLVDHVSLGCQRRQWSKETHTLVGESMWIFGMHGNKHWRDRSRIASSDYHEGLSLVMRSQHEVLMTIKDARVPLSDHTSALMPKCYFEYANFMAAYLGRKRKDRTERRRDDQEDQEEEGPTQPIFPESQLTTQIPMIEDSLHGANWGHGVEAFHVELVHQEMSQPVPKHGPKGCAKKPIDEKKAEGLFEIWFKENNHLYENLIEEERNGWYDITYEFFRSLSPELWSLSLHFV
ncbi:MAIN-LIKE 2-like protein [Drosera capensis]